MDRENEENNSNHSNFYHESEHEKLDGGVEKDNNYKSMHESKDETIDQNNQESQQSDIHDQANSTGTDESDGSHQVSPGDKAKKHSTKWGAFLRMLAAAILGSVLTLGAVTQLDYFQTNGEVPDSDTAPASTEQSDSSSVEPVSSSGSAADIVDDASDAIVGIVNLTDQQNPFSQTSDEVKRGVGSGVIYKVTDDSAYIVTNNHVIEDASSLQVSLASGDTVDGELVGADPLTDIAVIKVKGDYDVKPIKFGDSSKLRSGDPVIAIGNPLGLNLSRTVTQGIVSATDRTIPVQTSAGEWEFEVIQTDAAINPGNSGGALLNNAGELVGINSLKIADNGVEGLGFAIPSNDVKELIDELVENGKIVRPYAGVGIKSVNEIPPYYLQELPEKVKQGAVVLSVDENSSAAKAGIQVEDVIVGIDGEEVKSDKDFRSYLYKKASIGEKITIELYRGGEKQKVELELTSNADVQ